MVSDSAVRIFLLEFCLTRPTLTFNVVTGGQLEAMKPHDQLTKQRLRKTAFATSALTRTTSKSSSENRFGQVFLAQV